MNSKVIVPQLDRVDLADAQRRYGTTPWSCDCPDRRYRKAVCQHMAAAQDADAACLDAAPVIPAKTGIQDDAHRLGSVDSWPSPAQSPPAGKA